MDGTLAKRYFHGVGKAIDAPWRLSVGEDSPPERQPMPNQAKIFWTCQPGAARGGSRYGRAR